MSDFSRQCHGQHLQQKQKQKQNFHGAFPWGSSAGLYATVESNEGLKPPKKEEKAPNADATHTIKNNTRSFRNRGWPHRRLKDFMDDQDYNDWAGPSSLGKDYKNQYSATTLRSSTKTESEKSTIEMWMKDTVAPPANVGYRLLRVVGWREGSSAAYVPSKNPSADSGSTPPEANIFLSKKQLRMVRLQQGRIKLPVPNLDTCGLDFDGFQNAPEFKAYQEKRRKQAQRRASLGQHTRDVYRVSSSLGREDDTYGSQDSSNGNKRKHHNDAEDAYASYASFEAVEDFVGRKSVGGFALRADDDDAYDGEPVLLTKVFEKAPYDKEQYNNEIYEHSSDDEMNHHVLHNPELRKEKYRATTSGSSLKSCDLARALSSFAGICCAERGVGSGGEKHKTARGTAGRPPLTGFLLGRASKSRSMAKRYRGPYVPLHYEVNRHEFESNEYPPAVKAMSRSFHLETVDEERQQEDESLKDTANSSSITPSIFRGQARTCVVLSEPVHRSNAPNAGGAFAGLAEAMKSRFTSVADTWSNATGGPVKGEGPALHDEIANTKNANVERNKETVVKEIKISRTSHSFVPDRFLCRRFHVGVTVGSTHSTAGLVGGERLTEASYFKEKILDPAYAATGRDKSQAQAPRGVPITKMTVSGLRGIFNEDGAINEEKVQAAPLEELISVGVYKSIFEPQSGEGEDSSSSETEKGQC